MGCTSCETMNKVQSVAGPGGMADLEGTPGVSWTPPGRLKQGGQVARVTATVGFCYSRGQLVLGGGKGTALGT